MGRDIWEANMNILCFFIPSFFSVFLYHKIYSQKKAIDLVLIYGIFVFISNLISFYVLILIGGSDYYLNLESSPLSFVIKVLLLNLFLSIAVFFWFTIIEKRISLTIEVKGQGVNHYGKKQD